MTGLEEQQKSFIFTDSQITSENFLEDICCILNKTEVMGLF